MNLQFQNNTPSLRMSAYQALPLDLRRNMFMLMQAGRVTSLERLPMAH